MKNEACQSIQQMQIMMDNDQIDIDDPMDDLYGPVRLPFFKKGTLLYHFFTLNIVIYYLLLF